MPSQLSVSRRLRDPNTAFSGSEGQIIGAWSQDAILGPYSSADVLLPEFPGPWPAGVPEPFDYSRFEYVFRTSPPGSTDLAAGGVRWRRGQAGRRWWLCCQAPFGAGTTTSSTWGSCRHHPQMEPFSPSAPDGDDPPTSPKWGICRVGVEDGQAVADSLNRGSVFGMDGGFA